MPIVVQHDPDIALVGAVSESAGRGEFQKYKQEFEFRNQQFKQQIYNAQTQAVFQGIGAANSIIQPIMQMRSRERMQQAGFGFQREQQTRSQSFAQEMGRIGFSQQEQRDETQQGYQLDRMKQGLVLQREHAEATRIQEITNFKQNAPLWSGAMIEMGMAATPKDAELKLAAMSPKAREQFFSSYIGLKSKHALNKQTFQPWHFDFRASNALQHMQAGKEFQSATMRKAFKGLSKSIADGDVSINDPGVQREAQRIMQTLLGGDQVGSQEPTTGQRMTGANGMVNLGTLYGPEYEGVFGWYEMRGGERILRTADHRQTKPAGRTAADSFAERIKRTKEWNTARGVVASRLNAGIDAENQRRTDIDTSLAGDPDKPDLVLLPPATEADIDKGMASSFPDLNRAGVALNLRQGGNTRPPSAGYDHPTYESVEDAAQDPTYKAGRLTDYFKDVMQIDKYPLRDPIATEAALLHGSAPIKGGYVAGQNYGTFEPKDGMPVVRAAMPAMEESWNKGMWEDPRGERHPEITKYLDARTQGLIPKVPGNEPVLSLRLNPEMGGPTSGSQPPVREGMPRPITTPQPPMVPQSGVNRPGAMPFDVASNLISPDAPTDGTLAALRPYAVARPKYPGDTLNSSSQMFMQIRTMSKGNSARGLKPSPQHQFTVGDTKHNMFDFVEERVKKGVTTGRSGAQNLASYSKLRVQMSLELAKGKEADQGLVSDLNNSQKWLAATMMSDQLQKYAKDASTKQVVWTHMPVAWSPRSDPEMKDAMLFFPKYNTSFPLAKIPPGIIYVRPVEGAGKAKAEGIPSMLRVGMGITGLEASIQKLSGQGRRERPVQD